MNRGFISIIAFSILSLLFFNCSKVAFNDSQQSSLTEPNTDVLSVPVDPMILISEKKLNFGNTLVNDVATLSVTVTNKTSGPIIIESISVSEQMKTIYEISSQDCRGRISVGNQIAKDTSCLFEIKFRPSRIDSFTDSLSFKFKDNDHKKIDLIGAGVATPVPGACRSYPRGTTEQPTLNNRCTSGTPENFKINVTSSQYEWECRGTNNSATCAATYNPVERCDGGNSREQNIVKVLIDGTTIPHRTCSRNNLANGGKNCLDKTNGESVCCSDSGQVAINTSCVTPAGPGAYCFATSGCQAGLSCHNNVCK